MAYDLEQYSTDAVDVVVNSMMVHVGHIMTETLERRIEKDALTRERFLWLLYGATHCLAQQFTMPEELAFQATCQLFVRLKFEPGTALKHASRIRQQLIQSMPITQAMTNVGRQAMEDYWDGNDVYAFTKAVKLLEHLK